MDSIYLVTTPEHLIIPYAGEGLFAVRVSSRSRTEYILVRSRSTSTTTTLLQTTVSPGCIQRDRALRVGGSRIWNGLQPV